MNLRLSAFQDELSAMQKEAARDEEEAEREAKALAGAAIAASGMVGGAAVLGVHHAVSKSLEKAPTQALGTSVDALALKMGIKPPARAKYKKFAYLHPSRVKGKVLNKFKNFTAGDLARARESGVILGPWQGRPESVAHEMGHAANAVKNKVLTALANTTRRMGAAVPMAGAVAGGLMAIAPEDAESLVVKAAPLMPVLAYAPILADEALASVRAVKGMKAMGTHSSKVLRKAKGNLVKAFGTYLLDAAAMAVPVAAVAVGRVVGSTSKKEKTAGVSAYRRVLPSLFAHAYKEDEDFRKVVRNTLSTDPNTRRWQ